MNYQDFLQKIQETVLQTVKNGYDVMLISVIKNNDQVHDAITVTPKNNRIAPNVYLNEFYVEYLNGRDMESIIQEIISIVNDTESKKLDLISKILDFQSISNQITYRLVNLNMNKERLKGLPYQVIEDLAKVYYIVVESVQEGVSSIVITNDLLNTWKVNINQIDKLAYENTPFLFPSIIKNMNQCICDILSDQKEGLTINEDEHFEDFINDFMKDMSSKENDRMYVLSNNKGINGAGTILYPNILQDLAIKLNSDLYILPSSIHEVILLPARDKMSSRALREMVIDVNSSQVIPEEVLSNEVYYYDLSTDEFHIANYRR